MSQALMRQIGARHLNTAVTVMAWSNKMDLIAYGTEKGEVIIQRLNWQKVYTQPNPSENVQVRSISWQYNETVVAVGYSNGELRLLDVERKEVITSFQYEGDIKKVYFTRTIKMENPNILQPTDSELLHETFLPFLPKLNNLGVTAKAHDTKTFAKDEPCFLVIILQNGCVYFLLLAALDAGTMEISTHVQNPDNFEVIDVQFNGDFNCVYIIVRDGSFVKVLHFKSSILNEYIVSMSRLAVQRALVNDTKKYIDETVNSILEAWETVLLEMDNKLTQYANEQPATNLSADFLELLVFGYASNDIEEFLMRELTEKEIKKLQTSVDLSYSTIQTLVGKPLYSAGINMFYFMSTVKGLARNTYFYEPLLDAEDAENAVCLCGSFLMKIQEMQQVVDQSVKDIKLFFSWLYILIVRLNQEDLTENVPQLTTIEIAYLAEYLYSFEDSIVEKDGTITRKKFNLERVGQYLEDKYLQQPVKIDNSDLWQMLLEENACLRNSKLLYPLRREMSLIQERNNAFEAIEKVFAKCAKTMTANFELDAILNCTEVDKLGATNTGEIKCSFLTCDELRTSDMLAISVDSRNCLIVQINRKFTQGSCVLMSLRVEANCFGISSLITSYRYLHLIEMHFYNEEYLSILLRNTEATGRSYNHFIQIPFYALPNENKRFDLPQNLNLYEHTERCCVTDYVSSNEFYTIQGVCTDLAVSGSRKVAAVLSENRKKLTILEMEADENDDDGDTSQNNVNDLSH